jgi:deoxyribonuclease V
MDFPTLHGWDLTPAEAVALQRELAGRIDVSAPLAAWDLAAGADISYNRRDPTLYASVVVWQRSTGAIVEARDTVAPATFPYIPGMLSFREAPPVLACFARLRTRPDVLLCDGQGRAHPRRFGLACHLGLWLNLPTLGCAKSRLCGSYVEPDEQAGAQSPLTDAGETIGMVLRTKTRVNPVYVSPGYRIDLASAVAVVRACCTRYRLPEPTRLAHCRVNELRNGKAAE